MAVLLPRATTMRAKCHNLPQPAHPTTTTTICRGCTGCHDHHVAPQPPRRATTTTAHQTCHARPQAPSPSPAIRDCWDQGCCAGAHLRLVSVPGHWTLGTGPNAATGHSPRPGASTSLACCVQTQVLPPAIPLAGLRHGFSSAVQPWWFLGPICHFILQQIPHRLHLPTRHNLNHRSPFLNTAYCFS